MRPLQRADRLKEPPVLGRYYLVPAILFRWRSYGDTGNPLEGDGLQWWPVWGPKHNDLEYFNFENLHYHVDPRFLTKRLWKRFGSWREPLADLQATPLNHADLKDGPPKPTLRRMKCTMVHSEWSFIDRSAVIDMNKAFAGQQARHGKRGFVCPHKLFPLGTVMPVDGVVTCPLHGLRIDAATGRCVGPSPICEAEAA